jgi:hypothetical protein
MGAVGVTGATLLNFTSTLVRATVHCGNICLAFGQYNFKFLALQISFTATKEMGEGSAEFLHQMITVGIVSGILVIAIFCAICVTRKK